MLKLTENLELYLLISPKNYYWRDLIRLETDYLSICYLPHCWSVPINEQMKRTFCYPRYEAIFNRLRKYSHPSISLQTSIKFIKVSGNVHKQRIVIMLKWIHRFSFFFSKTCDMSGLYLYSTSSLGYHWITSSVTCFQIYPISK